MNADCAICLKIVVKLSFACCLLALAQPYKDNTSAKSCIITAKRTKDWLFHAAGHVNKYGCPNSS